AQLQKGSVRQHNKPSNPRTTSFVRRRQKPPFYWAFRGTFSNLRRLQLLPLRAQVAQLSCVLMKANALVMSRSQASVRLLVAAFAELGIEYRIALSGAEAIDILATEHHSALVVDFDLPQAAQV